MAGLLWSAVQAASGFGVSLFQVPANRWYDSYQTIIANDRGFDPAAIGYPDVTRPGWFSGRYGSWEQDFQEEMGRANLWWDTAASNGMRRFCYLGECGMDETLIFYNKTTGIPYALGYNSTVFLDKLRTNSSFATTAQWIGMKSWYSNPAWSSYITPAGLGLTNFTNPDGSSVLPDSNFEESLVRQNVYGIPDSDVITDPALSDSDAARLGIDLVSYKTNGYWVVKKTEARIDFGNPQVLNLLQADIRYIMARLVKHSAPGVQGLDGIHVDGLNHALSLYNPQDDAFGNWSRSRFRDYLSSMFISNQLVSIGVTNASVFDIRNYVQLKGWAYNDVRWNSDLVWQAYKIYYVQNRLALTASLRNTIKTGASTNGLDLAICGNMVPIWPGLGLQNDFLDICYFEWVPENGFGLHTYGLPHQGGRLGYIGRLASKVSKTSYSWSSISVVENEFKDLPVLHKTIAFNCFANRLIADWNYQMSWDRESPGTTNSFKEITEFIKAVSATGVSAREYVADIGIVYDAWEDLASVTVSDCFVEPFSKEFSGWCDYLEDRQLQWDVLFCKNNLRLSDLQKYKVVILPSYSTINKTAADAVETFVQNGGYVISTGLTGSRYDVHDYLMPRTTNTFDGFLHTNFHQTTNTPGMIYRDNYKDTGAATAMDALINLAGVQSSLAAVSPALNAGINLSTCTVNGDPRLTIDIVNWDYTVATDTMKPTPESWITVKLPDAMSGATNYSVTYMESSDPQTYIPVALPADRIAVNGNELSVQPYQTVGYQVLFIDAQ